jgi:predicted HTH transcriptional regulator
VLGRGLNVPARIRHTDDEIEAVVEALAQENTITNTAVRVATGVDRVEAGRILRRLVERGVLVQQGSRRGTRYVHRSRA